jgi:hypothetical protein
MTDEKNLRAKALELVKARNHKLLPFVRGPRSNGSRCVTCAKQVYVMPDPGLNGAAIGGDAITEVCFENPVRPSRSSAVPCEVALLFERCTSRKMAEGPVVGKTNSQFA